MRNIFNLISTQALLSECSMFFPQLLSWASWCYGSHPYLWHPPWTSHFRDRCSAWKLFSAMVLHKVIDADYDDCLPLILQAWYSDDADPKLQAVLCALSLIEDLNPSLGIFINVNFSAHVPSCHDSFTCTTAEYSWYSDWKLSVLQWFLCHEAYGMYEVTIKVRRCFRH